jgi:hypothetical protein
MERKKKIGKKKVKVVKTPPPAMAATLPRTPRQGTLFEPFFLKKTAVRKKSLIYSLFFDKKNLGEPETNLKSMGTS